MSLPSPNYIDKVVRWANGGVQLERVNFSPAQRFRALLCMEVYRKWIESPTTSIREMVKRLAARDYALFLHQAELGMEDAKEIVEGVGIRRDKDGKIIARKENEIVSDIYTVNQLCGQLSVSQNHLDKVLYMANTRWLSHFGQTTGNVSAIKEAQRNLEKINNDFKDGQNPADALKPGAERNVTNDISIIKPDRKNIDSEEMRKFAKQIGAKWEDVQEYYEDQNGDMVPVKDEEEDGQSRQSWGQAPGSDDHQEPVPKTAEPTDEPDTYDPFNQ